MTNPTRPLQHVPRLRYSTPRLGALEQSLQLLPPHIGLDDGQLARLPALWQRLAPAPSILTGIIEDTAPEFFGDAVADDGKRGPEKRRQVLACLRQRPDELRPWARG